MVVDTVEVVLPHLVECISNLILPVGLWDLESLQQLCDSRFSSFSECLVSELHVFWPVLRLRISEKFSNLCKSNAVPFSGLLRSSSTSESFSRSSSESSEAFGLSLYSCSDSVSLSRFIY